MDVELVVDAHAEVGEGPIWRASTGTLLWVDILGSTLHEFDPSTGRDAVTDVGQPVGTVVPRRSGGVVLALADGFVAMSDDGAFTRLADVEAENPAVRMNDGKCDSRGRLWAGTMPFDEERPIGALWCLEADHSVRRILGGTKVSNGIVWSHDDTYWGLNAANDDGGLGYIHLHKDRNPTEQEAAERAIAHFGGDVPEQTKR